MLVSGVIVIASCMSGSFVVGSNAVVDVSALVSGLFVVVVALYVHTSLRQTSFLVSRTCFGPGKSISWIWLFYSKII